MFRCILWVRFSYISLKGEPKHRNETFLVTMRRFNHIQIFVILHCFIYIYFINRTIIQNAPYITQLLVRTLWVFNSPKQYHLFVCSIPCLIAFFTLSLSNFKQRMLLHICDLDKVYFTNYPFNLSKISIGFTFSFVENFCKYTSCNITRYLMLFIMLTTK